MQLCTSRNRRGLLWNRKKWLRPGLFESPHSSDGCSLRDSTTETVANSSLRLRREIFHHPATWVGNVGNLPASVVESLHVRFTLSRNNHAHRLPMGNAP